MMEICEYDRYFPKLLAFKATNSLCHSKEVSMIVKDGFSFLKSIIFIGAKDDFRINILLSHT